MAIINQVLDFSKIESGKIDLHPVDFRLRQELADTLKTLHVRADAKGVKLSWHVDDLVPQWLRGDPTRLRQILVNLVGNGIKFSDRGEVFVDVQLEASSPPDIKLLFSVQDEGIGIADDKLDLIFTAFEQVDTSATREYGGTGLGLAITSRIVRAMGGDLWVESSPGEGSTFFFTVSLRAGEQPRDQSDRPSEGDLDSMTPLRILLAEDGKANQTMAVGLLKKWGHTVEVAENGREAIDAFLEGDFDAILMDVQMPQMDGLEATRRIRQYEAGSDGHIPIIAMTAHAMKGDRQTCLDAGMDDYLSKPVRKRELYRALGTLCTASEVPIDDPPTERSEAASDGSDAIIDWDAASEILGGDHDFHCKQIRKAVREIHALLPKLDDAIKTRDGEPARRIASSVKAAARSIVATRTSQAAATVEDAVADRDFEAASHSMSHLAASVEELNREMECSSGSR
jgi:hypothetical protein